MKKIFYLAFLVLALSTKGFADDKNESKEANVSYFAENNFLNKYQAAKDVKWRVTNNFQKAVFTLDGQKLSAFFDSNGEYIATTQYVAADKIPAVGQRRLTKLYNDYKVNEVVRYDFDGEAASPLQMLTGKRFYNTIYFANIKKGNANVLVKITPDGDVSFLKYL
ncbi:hypothetical protein ADIARSV_1967 [Arcticibacter svalbardensis MN12-7]|uniref:Beta-lactamase-inhibitor-like PepSY-like domain-containing protein n=1 Tax=Arcticibacter svalbardensis MN12-7 TaxID=1150600 RepID=R9GSM0_9SPHI|nr:hypothetical protein [Arcticibacter svalbardensis]EOR94862.1 hypothetical protein ADIARSV_1967 [Arcticibacter svalbardensis MN12-7]